MTRLRRFAALCLCLALSAALLIPAGAVSVPTLTYTQSGAVLGLKLQGLGSESVYGVELALTVAGDCTSATLSPAASAAYAPPCTCQAMGDATLVTLYLTGQAALNQNGALDLGTLTLSAALTPSDTATLTLLGHDLRPLAEAVTISVSRQTSSSSSSGRRPTQKPDPELETTPEPAPALPFADVAESDWFYDEVKYVYDKGMMNGTGDQSFAPDASTSRAMLVTVLYRLTGSPSAGTPSFPDVAAGQYYADAVGWAAQQAIVTGYENGLFAPDGLLTREQLAAVLYRYAKAMGCNTAARGDLTAFADRAAISPYATDAIAWAVGTGLLSGMGNGTIAPQGQATRAQMAAVLTRFCQTFIGPEQAV